MPCFFDKGATPQQIWQPPCSPCSSFVVTDQLCWPLDRMRLWFGRETKITLLFTHLDLSYDVQYTCRSNGCNWKQILQGFNVHFYNAGKSPQIWKKIMMKRQNKFFLMYLYVADVLLDKTALIFGEPGWIGQHTRQWEGHRGHQHWASEQPNYLYGQQLFPIILSRQQLHIILSYIDYLRRSNISSTN